MIYTTYFSNLRNLPENILPISIAGKAPFWYNGAEYKKLAPKYDFFMKWKENHDNDYYIKCFKEQVLNKINIIGFITDIMDIMVDNGIPDGGVALVCYERPEDFCHRHLVREWLNNNGFECREWENNQSK